MARHESISTTEKYYIGQNSEAMTDVAWAAWEAGKGKRSNKRPGNRPARKPRAEGEAAPVNTSVNNPPLLEREQV
jgi:hypothetical protein